MYMVGTTIELPLLGIPSSSVLYISCTSEYLYCVVLIAVMVSLMLRMLI